MFLKTFYEIVFILSRFIIYYQKNKKMNICAPTCTFHGILSYIWEIYLFSLPIYKRYNLHFQHTYLGFRFFFSSCIVIIIIFYKKKKGKKVSLSLIKHTHIYVFFTFFFYILNNEI